MMFGSDQEALSYAQEVCFAPFLAPPLAARPPMVHAHTYPLQGSFLLATQGRCCVCAMLMFLLM